MDTTKSGVSANLLEYSALTTKGSVILLLSVTYFDASEMSSKASGI